MYTCICEILFVCYLSAYGGHTVCSRAVIFYIDDNNPRKAWSRPARKRTKNGIKKTYCQILKRVAAEIKRRHFTLKMILNSVIFDNKKQVKQVAVSKTAKCW